MTQTDRTRPALGAGLTAGWLLHKHSVSGRSCGAGKQFELMTLGMAWPRRCSTTELFPHTGWCYFVLPSCSTFCWMRAELQFSSDCQHKYQDPTPGCPTWFFCSTKYAEIPDTKPHVIYNKHVIRGTFQIYSSFTILFEVKGPATIISHSSMYLITCSTTFTNHPLLALGPSASTVFHRLISVCCDICVGGPSLLWGLAFIRLWNLTNIDIPVCASKNFGRCSLRYGWSINKQRMKSRSSPND